MFRLVIPEIKDAWDEENEVFVSFPGRTLQLEHSLVSLSKWESKYHKAFLTNETKSTEEALDYIRFMTITQNVSSDTYLYLTEENLEDINAYIENPMTATKIVRSSSERRGSRETITSELIYYWMISLNIPIECQKWHLNRLLSLIEVCSIKNAPPKKRSAAQIMRDNKRLNDERKKRLNTSG